jgi:protein kinase A
MYGFFCDLESIYILMEYMEEGSLFYQVRLAKKFTEEDAGVKLLEVCEAVQYLHSLDILHRDIKPENIVISNVTPS